MGNAHAWRHRSGRGKACSAGCAFCKDRPKSKKYKNSTGNRPNPAAKRGGRRNPEKKVVIDAGRSVLDWVRISHSQRGLGS